MNGFFFLILILGGFLGIVILVINVIMNSINKRPQELNLFWIPVLMIVVGLFGFGFTVESDVESSIVSTTKTLEAESGIPKETTTEPETTTMPETVVEPETTTEEETEIIETTTIEETTSQESEEEFKASCEEIGYKKLLRTPDDYVGRRVIFTAKVQQVVDGGWLDDGTYYRIQTDNEGKEYFYDDEYFMYDCRTSDDMKILKDDVLKIYAEFAGLETVKRALTRTGEEVPAIKAYYVELISE